MELVSVDMADFLQREAGEVIGSIGETIFVGDDTPPEAQLIVAIIDSGTDGSDSPNIPYNRDTFNILVRTPSGNYREGGEMSSYIKTLLHGQTGLKINTSWYIQIFQMSGPAFVGKDKQYNNIFSTNYTTLRTSLI